MGFPGKEGRFGHLNRRIIAQIGKNFIESIEESKRDQFRSLIKEGYSVKEACELLDINVKKGSY